MKIKDKVLIVEDEQSISNFISMILTANGYDTIIVRSGEEALTMISSHCPDLIVLDLGLPDMDGLEVLKSVRKWSNLPVVVVSARTHEHDKVEALDYGADDYLVKPFEFAELMARLRALGRRSTQKIQQDIVEVGEFTLNRTAKVLKKKDKVIQLSPREFQIFDLLAQNIGIVVPRDIILDRIWGLESDVSSNNIDSYMKILRKKLDLGDGGTVIKTVRGVGYKLEAKS